MKNYNYTTYAILGILTTDCRTGYAIKQMIDRSLNHFWKISYGQIYPTLKLIVEEGLATISVSPDETKPGKNEYYLTLKGKEVLKNWLEEPIEQIPVERNELLLKLFFGRHQSNEKTVHQLGEYKRKLETRYATYTGIEQAITNDLGKEADASYWLFTLDYGKRVTKAAIEWCTFTLEEISKEE
ncbi:PadR family transcriptional regulator [Planococcus shenhongbingii]|uniref:PadR family transcriptional regulator n=1 Tax=Planococcus shenhongbingii TaxID=3058398 RepID=A0ABT8NFJ8_9BACL|nr:PadR family transcriptional regulator [Planococcus sp. N017]MDN7246260.1 PadR family transcriptional regulator [Planococcus sp. N017]